MRLSQDPKEFLGQTIAFRGITLPLTLPSRSITLPWKDLTICQRVLGTQYPDHVCYTPCSLLAHSAGVVDFFPWPSFIFSDMSIRRFFSPSPGVGIIDVLTVRHVLQTAINRRQHLRLISNQIHPELLDIITHHCSNFTELKQR